MEYQSLYDAQMPKEKEREIEDDFKNIDPGEGAGGGGRGGGVEGRGGREGRVEDRGGRGGRERWMRN